MPANIKMKSLVSYCLRYSSNVDRIAFEHRYIDAILAQKVRSGEPGGPGTKTNNRFFFICVVLQNIRLVGDAARH